MYRIFLDVARLGVPLISFDQEIGGGQSQPCYSRSHGHPPGLGRWAWTGFRDLCARILNDGRSVAPELGLFMENVSELAIPYMATYWSRQFGEVDHGAYGARGIGLFSYLYHEYVTAIGAACVQGQGTHGTRPSAQMRRKVLANNLVRGLIPGPFLHDVPIEPKDPWHQAVSPAYFSYCQPYAHFPEYLVLGKTVRPPVVRCETVAAQFYRNNPSGKELRPGGPRVVRVEIDLPAVVAGSFTAADGSVGTVLVNTTDQAQRATARFARTNAAVLYTSRREPVRTWKWTPSPFEFSVELEPYGVRFVVTH